MNDMIIWLHAVYYNVYNIIICFALTFRRISSVGAAANMSRTSTPRVSHDTRPLKPLHLCRIFLPLFLPAGRDRTGTCVRLRAPQRILRHVGARRARPACVSSRRVQRIFSSACVRRRCDATVLRSRDGSVPGLVDPQEHRDVIGRHRNRHLSCRNSARALRTPEVRPESQSEAWLHRFVLCVGVLINSEQHMKHNNTI